LSLASHSLKKGKKATNKKKKKKSRGTTPGKKAPSRPPGKKKEGPVFYDPGGVWEKKEKALPAGLQKRMDGADLTPQGKKKRGKRPSHSFGRRGKGRGGRNANPRLNKTRRGAFAPNKQAQGKRGGRLIANKGTKKEKKRPQKPQIVAKREWFCPVTRKKKQTSRVIKEQYMFK